jgi:exopolysaccharide biosynthesis polyprenyl glycosylphosphotransferase
VLIVYWIVNAGGVAAIREWVGQRLAASSPIRVLLVGTAEEIEQFLEGVGEPRLHHVDIVGAVAVASETGSNGHTPAPFVGGLPWLGEVGDLPRLLVEQDVGEIVLLSPLSWRDRLVDRMLRQSRRPRVSVVPSVYDILVGRVSSGRIHDIPVVEVVKNPRDDLAYLFKRSTDFLIAGILAVLTLPIAVLAAIAVKLSSPGPVFYRQRRVGQAGAQFTIWKFRTMFDHAEDDSGPVLARLEDRRVTPVGRWLRASRIDEIPQLWNVLNGTMSLIGPRPERPEFVRRYAEEIPGYLERLQVKPGLTGLAQVNGEYHTSPAYKLKYDLAYIYNYSITLDLKIMAETVKVMVTRRGV